MLHPKRTVPVKDKRLERESVNHGHDHGHILKQSPSTEKMEGAS